MSTSITTSGITFGAIIEAARASISKALFGNSLPKPPKSITYFEGYDAFNGPIRKKNNPYPDNSLEWEDWYEGFDEARDAAIW